MTDHPPAAGEIITLEKQKIKQASEMLARAFFDDPLFLYWFPDSEERARLATASFPSPLLYGRRYGLVHTTSPGVEGIAVWSRPDFVEMTFWRMLASGAIFHGFGIGYRSLRKMMYIGRHLNEIHHQDAPFPHWYLQILGVDPAHQGEGLGGRLLREGLKLVDENKMPCYLTTNKEKNLGFYEHHGFKVIREFVTPQTDFKHWSLLRK